MLSSHATINTAKDSFKVTLHLESSVKMQVIQLVLEDLFTLFGKVVALLEWELDGSDRHS